MKPEKYRTLSDFTTEDHDAEDALDWSDKAASSVMENMVVVDHAGRAVAAGAEVAAAEEGDHAGRAVAAGAEVAAAEDHAGRAVVAGAEVAAAEDQDDGKAVAAAEDQEDGTSRRTALKTAPGTSGGEQR